MNSVRVLDSHMAYAEAGTGPVPVIFLHGNPTSSYLWRNVIPHVRGQARCLAPDLIGMGGSGKPDIGYRFADHARYLDAWFGALGLGDVVIVGHDWGGALGMDWAARHPGRAKGIAVIETILRPARWAEYGPEGEKLFRAYRSAEGERLILDENRFIEFNLPRGVVRGLDPADHDAYRKPFPDRDSRKPVLAWPRELPIDGEPADVTARVDAYDQWMSSSPDVPKLIMSVSGGPGTALGAAVTWAGQTFANVEVEPVGTGGHHAPEDQPDAIGTAVSRWLERHKLVAAS
ncbi:MAG TPA: haloalkane dehalogenase [Trebonia sp.]|jgi:haloalkane dehalogenase